MRRLTKRSVELNADEDVVYLQHHVLLDEGKPTPEAASIALSQMAYPSDEFIEWLSEGTCRRWGRRVLVKPEARAQMKADQRQRAGR